MDKIRKQPVDWKRIYENAPANIWTAALHHYSVLATALVAGGVATDLGCGEGYDACYLAEQGFDTIAIDISEVALQGLEERAKSMGVNVQTKMDNVKTVKLPWPQAIIASYGVLHFLESQSKDQIRHFQDVTMASGVHAIYTFGNSGDFYDIGKHKYWFPDMDELRVMYADWNIFSLEEKSIEMLVRGDNNEILHNKLIKILAQKR